jgi:hypothetical protein
MEATLHSGTEGSAAQAEFGSVLRSHSHLSRNA